MLDNQIYPWQEKDYKYLLSLRDKVPHALLLHGPNGLGLKELGEHWIRVLFCQNPIADMSCGNCQACTLLADGNHPDFYRIISTLDEDKKSISVDIVRGIVEFLAVGTHLAKYKIVLIEDCNLLSISSANALLKILEEPPRYALFILLSDNIEQILPTIKSRCLKHKLTIPDTTDAIGYLANKEITNGEFWLNFYANCPLFELEINEEQLSKLLQTLTSPSIDNIYALTIEFDGKVVSFTFILDFLSKWMSDLLSYKLANKLNYFIKYQLQIKPLLERMQVNKIFYLADQINFLMPWAKHPLNYKLQIECLLFKYQQAFVR